MLILTVTRQFWVIRIGQSLVCTEQLSRSDLILVENLDQEYLLFEEAATLQKQGLGARVLIPVQLSNASERANTVSLAVAKLMAHEAQLEAPEILPIRAVEPISLHAAYEIRSFLNKEHLRTVIAVVSGFRSMRSSLIYHAVMDPARITVSCVPVFTGANPKNWSRTWHGVQEVTEQFVKLLYYRFYVLLKPVSRSEWTQLGTFVLRLTATDTIFSSFADVIPA